MEPTQAVNAATMSGSGTGIGVLIVGIILLLLVLVLVLVPLAWGSMIQATDNIPRRKKK